MEVIRFINNMLNSNSYIISCSNKEVWVIDPGDSSLILSWINSNNKVLKGILVTHYHFDHIYGINDLQVIYPDAKVYSSLETYHGLCSSKLNMSFYNETPFEIKNNDVNIIKHEDRIELWDEIYCTAYETLGHNNDCYSFYVNNCLFTGDALIPGVKLYLGAKKANKDQAYKTIDWIINTFDGNTIIYPGHNESAKLEKAVIIR